MEITFNTGENKLIVTFEDGTIKEYVSTDAEQYLNDYPDRMSDLVAMGWK